MNGRLAALSRRLMQCNKPRPASVNRVTVSPGDDGCWNYYSGSLVECQNVVPQVGRTGSSSFTIAPSIIMQNAFRLHIVRLLSKSKLICTSQ